MRDWKIEKDAAERAVRRQLKVLMSHAGSTFMPLETMTLRDAALKLAELHRVRDKVPAGMLLAKLKAGKITAGFRFPGRSDLWVEIPAQYWSEVSSDKFKKIRSSSKNSRTGSFKIRPGHFASAVVSALGRIDLNDLSAILNAASRQCEIEVDIKELENYKARNSLQEMKEKKGPGRRESLSWKRLCPIIGTYIGQYYYRDQRAKPFKIDDASREIRAIAEQQNVEDLVDWTSIKPVLSEIFDGIHHSKPPA